VKTLRERIAALEERARQAALAPEGALPIVVDPKDLNSPEALAQRARGYFVVTYEQCVELMV
jgi:hypothetical protein